MKTLERYIGLAVAKSYVIIIAILVPLFSFLAFVEQLEDVGKGEYRPVDALFYVMRTVPGRLLDLAPFTALLGSILALGVLAKTSELTAMRAAGMSTVQVSGAVLKPGGVVMLTAALFAQFVVPPLDQWAEKRRSLAVSGTGDLLTEQGFWSREGRRFLNVRAVEHGRIPTNIEIFEFDPKGQLRIYVRAAKAAIEGPRRWELIDVQQKILEESGIQSRRLPHLTWEPFLSKRQVQVLELPAPVLSPSDLYHYSRYLGETGQEAARVELIFWQKTTLPLAVGAMLVLGLSFIFGSAPGFSVGRRLALGTLAGIAFHLLNQIVANLGLLVGLSPALIVAVPLSVAVLFALYMMRRAR
jgi:lipopolysaccharide export system permease protein